MQNRDSSDSQDTKSGGPSATDSGNPAEADPQGVAGGGSCQSAPWYYGGGGGVSIDGGEGFSPGDGGWGLTGIGNAGNNAFPGGGGASWVWTPSDCVEVVGGDKTCEDGYYTLISLPGDNSGGGNNSDVHGQWYYFFKDFSVFGPKNDPRPSCFAGFLKDTVGNFFGYSGADVAGGVASATYILTPPSLVPPTMALRGGKYALNWVKADQAARVGKAAKTGLLVNLVFAEGLALGSEVDSALNGNCK